MDEWFKRSDDDFRTGLRDVIAYVQLSGSLSALSDMLTNDLAVLDHRERMRLDEIATSAQARLATLGLQGVASFAEGGITEEQIANWLRALEVIGVGVIGGRI